MTKFERFMLWVLWLGSAANGCVGICHTIEWRHIPYAPTCILEHR